MIYFTVFHEHFVEDKIRQFVDLCSISNVSGNATGMFLSFSVWGEKNVSHRQTLYTFIVDLRAAVISPLFWLLHPRALRSRTRRHKHGGNEQQSEERGSKGADVLLNVLFNHSIQLHHFITSVFFLPQGVSVWTERSSSQH